MRLIAVRRLPNQKWDAPAGHLRRTAREWQAFAVNDPLHAIASWEGTAGGGWSPEAFYALGRSDWDDFRRQWLQYATELGGTCLEFGSGAGRITKPMGETFAQVIATDISPEMLRLVERSGANAERRLVEGVRLPADTESVDAIFTCHVLQHQENLQIITGYLREMHRVLRRGGTIMAHLLLEDHQSRLRRVYAGARMRVNRLDLGRYRFVPRVRVYNRQEIRETLETVGFHRVELREFRVASNQGEHAFWLAAKP